MTSRYLRLSLASALFILGPCLASAQQPTEPPVDQANVVLSRRLLEVMHIGENMVAGLDASMTEERRLNTQVSPIVFDSIAARIRRSVPEVLDSIAPSYARRFTGPELQAMVAFYESPPGKSLASAQAGLTVELTQFAQRWGLRLAAGVTKDLKGAGIDLRKH